MTALTYIDGSWHTGNPPILGSMSHASWLASMIFDGARAFEGVAPDLDLHCARAVASARRMGLGPMLSPGEIEDIARDGIQRFARGAELYIRPMFFAETGIIVPEPASTRFVLAVYDEPLPKPTGFSCCLSSFRRPSPDMAPTDAKASCLYPNTARAMGEARAKGFDNAVVLDALGNVAEFATANLFIAKDGAVHTPACNGTFLNGITRQRVIALLERAHVTVYERRLTMADILDADEVFSSGNFGKVIPVTRVEQRDLQPGRFFDRARSLYWDFAHSA
ncbi:MAG TPA: branched-chain amino acid aminotransferase [Stellaceae bacterium]|nr:branched-chain amino acid aminotransferase [Stellaceae bacterium]